jgi:hypothetical protein
MTWNDSIRRHDLSALPSRRFAGPLGAGLDQDLWITSAGLIVVYFGPDGRLQHKYNSTVHEIVAPSLINWLSSRPRMIRQSFGLVIVADQFLDQDSCRISKGRPHN